MVCTKCGQDKLEEQFSWKNKTAKVRHSQCKECKAAYSNRHYRKNRKKRLNQVRMNNNRYKQRIRDWIWDYICSNPCVDCNNDDPLVLEFDHRSDKSFAISTAQSRKISIAKLEKEVGKCDVRCANCHNRRTAIERGYWKDKLEQ